MSICHQKRTISYPGIWFDMTVQSPEERDELCEDFDLKDAFLLWKSLSVNFLKHP